MIDINIFKVVSMINISLYGQESFANRFSDKFKGRKRTTPNGDKIYEYMECPCCRKKKLFLFVGERRDTYLLKCHIYGCILSESITLHRAIERYSPEMKNEWNISNKWRQPEWNGIKNRIPRGKSSKKNDHTFREKMESSSLLSHLRFLMEEENSNNMKFKTFNPPSIEDDKKKMEDKWFEDLMYYFNIDSIGKLPKLVKIHGLPTQEDIKRKRRHSNSHL